MNKKDFIESLNLLKVKGKGFFSDHDSSRFLVAFRKECFDRVQSYTPDSLAIIYEKIRNTKSAEELEIFRKIMILECLLNSWNDIFSDKYPPSIQIEFKKNSERMLKMCQNDTGWREYSDDDYWKDLAIARQQMYPAGAGIVEIYSGFGLRQGLSLNLRQSFRFLKLLISSRGRRGYFQIHTHTPLLCEFNEQGWNDCYMRISEMLVRHEDIKGVFRASWFCDPELAKTSPRLEYLQKMPVENGAKNFYIQADQTGNPFVKSKTRLKLYKEGKYKPKTYLLVWPRKELIKWARTSQEGHM